MEDTLREKETRKSNCRNCSLNPCFNGRYSQSSAHHFAQRTSQSLNPCFNGRYSQSFKPESYTKDGKVLILVLMEDTLREVRVEDPKPSKGS